MVFHIIDIEICQKAFFATPHQPQLVVAEASRAGDQGQRPVVGDRKIFDMDAPHINLGGQLG
jgi:hypothetical protein